MQNGHTSPASTATSQPASGSRGRRGRDKKDLSEVQSQTSNQSPTHPPNTLQPLPRRFGCVVVAVGESPRVLLCHQRWSATFAQLLSQLPTLLPVTADSVADPNSTVDSEGDAVLLSLLACMPSEELRLLEDGAAPVLLPARWLPADKSPRYLRAYARAQLLAAAELHARRCSIRVQRPSFANVGWSLPVGESDRNDLNDAWTTALRVFSNSTHIPVEDLRYAIDPTGLPTRFFCAEDGVEYFVTLVGQKWMSMVEWHVGSPEYDRARWFTLSNAASTVFHDYEAVALHQLELFCSALPNMYSQITPHQPQPQPQPQSQPKSQPALATTHGPVPVPLAAPVLPPTPKKAGSSLTATPTEQIPPLANGDSPSDGSAQKPKRGRKSKLVAVAGATGDTAHPANAKSVAQTLVAGAPEKPPAGAASAVVAAAVAAASSPSQVIAAPAVAPATAAAAGVSSTIEKRSNKRTAQKQAKTTAATATTAVMAEPTPEKTNATPAVSVAGPEDESPLPEGWTKEFSEEHQHVYYCCVALRRTSWTRPKHVNDGELAPAEGDDQPQKPANGTTSRVVRPLPDMTRAVNGIPLSTHEKIVEPELGIKPNQLPLLLLHILEGSKATVYAQLKSRAAEVGVSYIEQIDNAVGDIEDRWLKLAKPIYDEKRWNDVFPGTGPSGWLEDVDRLTPVVCGLLRKAGFNTSFDLLDAHRRGEPLESTLQQHGLRAPVIESIMKWVTSQPV